jgi:hypothetical protein
MFEVLDIPFSTPVIAVEELGTWSRQKERRRRRMSSF